MLLVVPSVQGSCAVNQYDTGTDVSSTLGTVYETRSASNYWQTALFKTGPNIGKILVSKMTESVIYILDTAGTQTSWVGSGTEGTDTSGTGTSINIGRVGAICLNPDNTKAYAITYKSQHFGYVYEIDVATTSVTKQGDIGGTFPSADGCVVSDTHLYGMTSNMASDYSRTTYYVSCEPVRG